MPKVHAGEVVEVSGCARDIFARVTSLRVRCRTLRTMNYLNIFTRICHILLLIRLFIRYLLRDALFNTCVKC